MARRKLSCLKWTVVLLAVLVCPCVYSRPQESGALSTTSIVANNTGKITETPTRYRFRSRNVRLPLVTNVGNLYNLDVSKIGSLVTNEEHEPKEEVKINDLSLNISNSSITEKSSRLLKKRKTSNKNKPNRKITENVKNVFKIEVDSTSNENSQTKRKPTIRKVLTKWTDNAKVQELGYTPSVQNHDDVLNFISTEDYSSTELQSASSELPHDLSTEASKISGTTKLPEPTASNKLLVKINNRDRYRPGPDYSEESSVHTNKVHSNKVHIVDSFASPIPSGIYLYTTPMPRPIITHVGTPVLWGQNYQQNVHNRRPTTRKPIRNTPLKNQYDYHHVVNNDYPQYPNYNTHEATTFSPVTAYTERIVIRPEEYAAPSADCPTIYLTLNNSFQGQGKEACPDLNIAVNTNVVNKNVVVETEENTDNLYSDVFGLPLDADESLEDANTNESYDSEDDAEGQSASVENGQLTSYHSNGDADSDSSGSNAPLPGNGLSSLTRPNKKRRRPHKNKGDDDTFSVSALVRFFQPALNVLGWLGALNPINFSFLTLLFTPLALLLAGSTGVTGILPFAREAPEEIHILRPKWHWDNYAKTWHLDSFPERKNRLPRDSNKKIDKMGKSQGWFYEVKKWFKDVAQTWKRLNSKGSNSTRKRRRARKSQIIRLHKNG